MPAAGVLHQKRRLQSPRRGIRNPPAAGPISGQQIDPRVCGYR